ncbi:YfjI family protein [Methylomagnum ishizawai]|uniref:YfjI family protein n=1 Tax=Methylomagnum ishizawai TaxID=1760988 RepID=UPI001C3336E9|nr:YfjI family protein [Methylomagnum ishizawai]BBL74445.1 hypothetical protein MishRS11D_15430 [Methylomagnum ishizawai]
MSGTQTPVKALIDGAAPPPGAGVSTPKPAPRKTPPSNGPEAWPEPILPAHSVPQIPASALPGWAGDMAAAVAASTQTPEALAVMTALSVLATVLQGRFEVAPWGDDYREVLALWTLSAAPSGSRKSAVLAALTEPLLAWEKCRRDRIRPDIARVESAREVAKKRIEELKRVAAKAKTDEDRERLRADIQKEIEGTPAELIPPRLFSGDVTPERLQAMLAEHSGRMSILADEGGVFQIMSGQYSGGRASLDVFLQSHCGSPIRVDRAGRLAHIDRPTLSFGLLLQPDILADVAKSRNFRGSGLLARFLYAMPVSTVGRRNVRDRRAVPPEVQATWNANIHAMLDGLVEPTDKPRVIPFTPEALEYWLEFSEYVEANQGAGCKWADINDWTGKLPGAVARIAGLLELAANGTGVESVGADSMARALALGDLLVEHALAAFALMGAGKAEDDAGAVLAWIKAHRLDGFTRRELQKALESRFRTTERLLAAIKLLQEWGCLSDGLDRHPSETGGKGGRPSVVYLVNPRLLSTKAT